VTKSIVVFAVPHPLQGPGFVGYKVDDDYVSLIEDLISRRVDFVFEEAGGRKPSIAESIAEEFLGAGHYMDVDPASHERSKFGISTPARSARPNLPGCEYANIELQRKREELWTQRVLEETFTSGLAICGPCHCLSYAFRLESAGVDVIEVHTYLPYDKLCKKSHLS
jgi:hypothetical protein